MDRWPLRGQASVPGILGDRVGKAVITKVDSGSGSPLGGHRSPVCLQVRASLVAQLVKNLPAMLQTWVQSLGGEDPLEKEIATHSSILALKNP